MRKIIRFLKRQKVNCKEIEVSEYIVDHDSTDWSGLSKDGYDMGRLNNSRELSDDNDQLEKPLYYWSFTKDGILRHADRFKTICYGSY